MSLLYVERWLSDLRPGVMPIKLLVCGDRNWQDVTLIDAWLRALITKQQVTLVAHGACSGADQLAAYVAKTHLCTVKDYPVTKLDWKKYGKRAGPIRNQLMLDDVEPDLVVAFHDYLDGSKGTKDMTQRALRANVPCVVVSHVPKVGAQFVAPSTSRPIVKPEVRIAGME